MGTNHLLEALVDTNNSNLSFGVITVAFVCALMLIANMLRRLIPFLRRSLMPTAVIAGLMGLILKELIHLIFKVDIITDIFFNQVTIGAFIYHALPIGFIALCLREKDDYTYDFDKDSVKRERVAGFKSGSVIVNTYLMQAIVGILVTVLLAVTFMPELNKAVGIILPLGFGQGPQQAAATGGVWDKNSIFSFWDANGNLEIGKTFGITVAAFGFLWASIPGVFMVNRIAKKKGLILKRNEYQKSGDIPSTTVEEAGEVPLSESIDKFTLQVCMVGGVYLITMGIIVGIEALFRLSGVQFLIELLPTIWGFSFMIAVLVALLTKMILRRLVKKGVMKRKYPNSYMLNRISGAAFDISIAGALMLISIEALGSLWIPVLIMSTLGGVASIFYVRYVCNRIYKDYKDEAFLAMYGMLTGTISNGMILLREIDGEFKTPAADDLVIGSSSAIILGFPLLLLVAQAPVGNNWWWVALVITAYFAALTAYQFLGKKKPLIPQPPIQDQKPE